MIRIRSMTVADVGLGMRLKEQAGWNQTEADWQRCLDLEPEGCFVAEYDGSAVGTNTTCIFGKVAWIAMVLVDAAFRGRGIGKALMEYALRFLDGAGVNCIRLDATPLGQPLYKKLGFVTQFQLCRYEGVCPVQANVQDVELAPAERWDHLMDFDAVATRTNRHKLLRRLLTEQPQSVRFVQRGGAIAGYLAIRQGSRAVQIGPCIADSSAGPLLLTDACHRFAGKRVYLDVAMDNRPATEFVSSLGLTVQRHLTRMCRGEQICEDIAKLWTSFGPEKG
jgi:ribosomal protein S18 acetylase RimI-like enzyme